MKTDFLSIYTSIFSAVHSWAEMGPAINAADATRNRERMTAPPGRERYHKPTSTWEDQTWLNILHAEWGTQAEGKRRLALHRLPVVIWLATQQNRVTLDGPG
jgi:hypothetical protein